MSQGTIGNSPRIQPNLKRGRNISEDSPEGYHDHRRAIGLGVAVVGLGAIAGSMAGQAVNQSPQTVTVVPTNEATPGAVFAPAGAHQYQDHSFSNPAAAKAGTPTKGSTTTKGSEPKGSTTTKGGTTKAATSQTAPKTSVKVKLTAKQTNPKTVQTSIGNMLKNGQIYQATPKFDTKNPGKALTNTTHVYNNLKGNQPIYYHSDHGGHDGKGQWMEFRSMWDLEFYEGYMLGSAGWGAPIVPVYYYPVWSDPGYYDGTCGMCAPGTYGSDVGPDGTAPVYGSCTSNTCAAGWQDCAPPVSSPDSTCANSPTCAPLPQSNDYNTCGTSCTYTPPSTTCVGCSNGSYSGTTCSGSTSTCSGSTSTCSGSTSTCSGSTSTCSGSTSTCSGSTSTCSGSTSTCSGSTSTCSGSTSTCSGSTSTCSGSTSTCSGYSSGSTCTGSSGSTCTGGGYSGGGCSGGFAGCAVRSAHSTTVTPNVFHMSNGLGQLLMK